MTRDETARALVAAILREKRAVEVDRALRERDYARVGRLARMELESWQMLLETLRQPAGGE